MQYPPHSITLNTAVTHSTLAGSKSMLSSWLLDTDLSGSSLLGDDPCDTPLDNGYILEGHKRLKFIKFLGAGAFGYVFLAEDLDWNEPVTAGDSEKPSELNKLPLRAEAMSGTPGYSFSSTTSKYMDALALPSDAITSYPSRRYYAVKCLDNNATTHEKRQREIQNHFAVQGHRGVVELYETVQKGGWTFLILEYAEEGDMLRSMAKQNIYATCDLRLGQVFGQAVDAVRHCHRTGVYHRGLKPENIMCRKGGMNVILGDFGLSTTTKLSNSFGCGSAYYMSPECAGQGYLAHSVFPPAGWEPQPFDTAKNDVWCLGVILFNMICGLTPWEKARDSDIEFKHYLRHPLHLRHPLPISWSAFSLFLQIFDPNPETRITLDALKAKLRDIRNFRMAPWEIEASSPEIRCAAEAWLPNVSQPRSSWTRYETYPEHLDFPRPCSHCYSTFGRPCGSVGSEDIVPCLEACGDDETGPESTLVTPEGFVRDPVLDERYIPELDLADGMQAWNAAYANHERLKNHERPAKVLPSIPVPLDHWFNNLGSGPKGNFDGAGGAFPAHALPVGEFEYDRVQFRLPKFGSGHGDNVIPNGEVIKLDTPQYIREIHILYAGDHNNGETDARFKFEYEDDSTQEIALSVKNWWVLNWENKGVIQTPYHTTEYGKSINHNFTQIHHWLTALTSNSPLRSITLPTLGSYNRFHLFALSLVPAGHLLGCAADAPYYGAQFPMALAPPAPGPQLTVRRARVTHKLYEAFDRNGNPHELGGAQLVEVTLANMRPTAAGADSRCWGGPMHVWVHGNHFYTVKHGQTPRLMPGDEVKVRVWVRNFEGVIAGEAGTMRIEIRDASRQGDVLSVSEDWPAVAGIPRYEETTESLGKHETPLWWDDAKFGIFIHWGIYSVPAWSPKGYYAAWYNWWLHNPPGPQNILWNYHKKYYGEDFVYDDFIPHFTASEFNASQWVQLFTDAGAKYFVLVTKHHEGFSLFDTGNSTHRSSVHLGPKRDFVAELMHAARTEHPELRRGTYYSLPEWFNPDFGPYGFGNFPGHLARNAYNKSRLEAYVGHLEGKEYLRDIQLAHMRTLAHTYDTEIMWCDLNGPNKTLEFAAEWYNRMVGEGREVALNNRCGAIPDFDTPEYTKFSSIQERKWETSEGIDPVCYGYNWETKDDEYRSVDQIINKLVDITSKNGNYLLNLGPTHTGHIIKPMVDRVVGVGRWLKHSGDCVYETNYYYLGSDEGDLRFTRTPNTTCVIALSRPQNGTVIIEKPLPLLTGDTISLLGAPSLKGGLKWSRHGGKVSPAAFRKLVKEIQQLRAEPPEGIRVVPSEENMLDVTGIIAGPEGTPYAGGYYHIHFTFPATFPASPPSARMVTRIFHPNVSRSGEICVNTLKKDWKPTYGLGHLLVTIKCLLIVPNAESALDEEAGKLLLEDWDEYCARAKMWCSVHATPKVPPVEFETPASTSTATATPVPATKSIAVTPENASASTEPTSPKSKLETSTTPVVQQSPLQPSAAGNAASIIPEQVPTTSVKPPSTGKSASGTENGAGTGAGAGVVKTTAKRVATGGVEKKKKALKRL